ncbi:antitoxin [Dactylosporangium sp. AC04546]|uniref:antitoxin n=1 Tax=Dactylosporangium sp. AC04546 TaxID=2862460 RepID=UPI001EDDDAB0|nr:antitoxin [Dactylosporangium sp. AC04546]WVK79960.1 antitoxin [Dactylosporangium sp. AC04546]
MNSFFDKVKDLADQHDDKVDAALEKVGDQIDERTGNKYSDHIDKAVDAAQERTGDGDTTRA